MLLYAMINANCIHAAELERMNKERQLVNGLSAQMQGQNAANNYQSPQPLPPNVPRPAR